MNLISKIKEQQLAARKTHASVVTALLTTLIGESEMVGKNANRTVTDDEVIAMIKKFIKNIDMTLSVVKEPTDKAKCTIEKQILESYLPKQLSEADLRVIITKLKEVHSGNVGLIMKELKTSYAGLYDGKLASEICKGN